jgi:hypothetical protein
MQGLYALASLFTVISNTVIQARFSNCGNTLKQFQPSESGNTSRGTGNDSWYGKIEIDLRKEMGYLQPSTICRLFNYIDKRVCSSTTKRESAFFSSPLGHALDLGAAIPRPPSGGRGMPQRKTKILEIS